MGSFSSPRGASSDIEGSNSSTSSSIEIVNGTSLDEFLTTLVFCGLLALFMMVMFVVLRKKYGPVYHPKATRTGLVPPPSSALSLFYNLIIGQPDSAVLREQGLDALLYLSFTKGCLLVSFILSVEAVVTLIPIDIFGGDKSQQLLSSDSTEPPDVNGIDVTSISNVADGSPLLWAHLVSMFVNSAVVWLMVLWLYRKYVSLLHAYRKSGDIHHLAVFFENVPRTWDAQKLQDFLLSTFPDVVSVKRVVVIPLIDQTIDARNRACIEAERTLLKLNKSKSKKRPTHRVPPPPQPTLTYRVSAKCCLCCVGERVDSIKYYQGEVRRLDDLLDSLFEEQAKLSRFTNFAFVLFSTAASASVCAYRKTIPNPEDLSKPFLVKPAPHPNDIVWHALLMPRRQKIIRRIGYIAIMSGITLFWTVPMAFVASLGSLSFLSQIEFLSFLTALLQTSPVVLGILQGLLPPIVTLLVIASVPVVILKFASKVGIRKRSDVVILGTATYFVFLVVNVILVSVLAGSMFTDLYMVLDDIMEYAELFALSIPLQATYFINYIQLITILGPILSMTRLGNLLRLWITPKLMNCTPRDTRKLTNPGSMPWVPNYSRNLLVLAVGILFSSLSPMVVPFAVIYFFFAHIAGQYLLRFVFQRKYESGGSILQWLCHGTLLSLIMYQITTLGVLELKKFTMSTVGLVLPVSTIALWVYIHWYFQQQISATVFDEVSPLGDDSVLLDTPHFSVVQAESGLNYDSPSLQRNVLDFEHQPSEHSLLPDDTSIEYKRDPAYSSPNKGLLISVNSSSELPTTTTTTTSVTAATSTSSSFNQSRNKSRDSKLVSIGQDPTDETTCLLQPQDNV
ncbi:early responsive to dehydration protein [Pelomyxa schiedti]|nr:early responsive to dehydration protein [Pelomyxa schiedti]